MPTGFNPCYYGDRTMKTTQEHLEQYKKHFITYLSKIPIEITNEELFDTSAESNGFKHGHHVKRLWNKIYNTAPARFESPQEGYKYANNACRKRYGFILINSKILPWN